MQTWKAAREPKVLRQYTILTLTELEGHYESTNGHGYDSSDQLIRSLGSRVLPHDHPWATARYNAGTQAAPKAV